MPSSMLATASASTARKPRADDKEHHDGTGDDVCDRRPGVDVLGDEPLVPLAAGADLRDHPEESSSISQGSTDASSGAPTDRYVDPTPPVRGTTPLAATAMPAEPRRHEQDAPEVDEHDSLGEDAVVHEASGPDGTPGAGVDRRKLGRRAAASPGGPGIRLVEPFRSRHSPGWRPLPSWWLGWRSSPARLQASPETAAGSQICGSPLADTGRGDLRLGTSGLPATALGTTTPPSARLRTHCSNPTRREPPHSSPWLLTTVGARAPLTRFVTVLGYVLLVLLSVGLELEARRSQRFAHVRPSADSRPSSMAGAAAPAGRLALGRMAPLRSRRVAMTTNCLPPHRRTPAVAAPPRVHGTRPDLPEMRTTRGLPSGWLVPILAHTGAAGRAGPRREIDYRCTQQLLDDVAHVVVRRVLADGQLLGFWRFDMPWATSLRTSSSWGPGNASSRSHGSRPSGTPSAAWMPRRG